MIFVANWKADQNLEGAAAFIDHLKKSKLPQGARLIVCPPASMLSLPQWQENLPLSLGAQDVSPFLPGAQTGEITAQNLKELGVKYCLVGHSERRKQGEKESLIKQKLERLLEVGITPLLCFSKEEQIEPYSSRKDVIFCLEPPENISGGKQFKDIDQKQIRKKLARLKEVLGKGARIIYGGSVHEGNAQELAEIPLLDGFLVGQASLKYASFSRIIYAVS